MKWTPKNTLIVAGVAVLGVWYLKGKAGEVAESVDRNFNPTKDTNLANRGAQGLWDMFTDGEGTIGTDFYDFDQKYSPYALADRVRDWVSDTWRD